jgi:hypothetical protein
MTTEPATATQAQQTLLFKEYPIRIVMVDSVPWFSLEDVTEALGYTHLSTKRAFHETFPEHARMDCLEETEEGQITTTVLSPVGVWHFTAILDAYRGQGLANWARKEALRLHPNPRQTGSSRPRPRSSPAGCPNGATSRTPTNTGRLAAPACHHGGACRRGCLPKLRQPAWRSSREPKHDYSNAP